MRAHFYLAMAIAFALFAGILGVLRFWSDNPAAARGSAVQIGIQDDRLSGPRPDVTVADRLGLVDDLGAKLLRVDLRWDLVAPGRPAKATDPADPAYNWAHYDAVVAGARSREIRVLFTLWGTPAWAVDPTVRRPEGIDVRAVRPARANDVGAFATAAARRYGPRGVHLWEGWNEPNIPLFLYPQIERRKGGPGFVVTSPRTYSAIQKAVYRGISSVDRAAIVAGLVTAPAGDPFPATAERGSVTRVPPRVFLRALNAKGLRPPMDAVSHHPYPLKPPHPIFAGASYIDVYSLSQLTDTIDSGYLAGKPVWLTEFGVATAKTLNLTYFRSRPVQAEYLTDAVRRVRANPRVKMFIWYLLQDHRDWKSGLLEQSGAKKPAAKAFEDAARGR